MERLNKIKRLTKLYEDVQEFADEYYPGKTPIEVRNSILRIINKISDEKRYEEKKRKASKNN